MSDDQGTASGERPLRVLTVCTHNRTRSVMMMALLQAGLDERGRAAVIRSSGFGPEDVPAIPDAVAAMNRRGLDVSGHRSRRATADMVAGADLVLTAERDHVVGVVSMAPEMFGRTFTMPEFLVAADRSPAGGSPVGEWVSGLGADRTPAAYLRDRVPEIDDPTGAPPRIFEAAVVAIEEQCAAVVDHLVAAG